MKAAFMVLASALFIARAPAQAAVVTRSAYLRAGPSRAWPVREKLAPDDELLLADAAPTNGYYEVRAPNGEGGWVSARHVRITDLMTDASSAETSASIVVYVVDAKHGSKAGARWRALLERERVQAFQGHWVRFPPDPLRSVSYRPPD